MEPIVIQQLTKRVFELLEETMGAKGRTLEKRLAYVQRKLPGRVKRAGAVLVDAQGMADSPRLAMQLDSETVSAAYDEIERYLKELDVAAEKSRKRYNVMAAVAAQFLLVVGALVALLVWLGYI